MVWELHAEAGAGLGRARVRRILEIVGKKFKTEPGSASFQLVSLKTMRALNKKTRGLDKPTNVLSFPNRNFPSGGRKFLGEVFLCLPEAKRRGDEPAHLVIHGLLHLLGYTHSHSRDTMKMENQEDELLDYVAHNYRA